MSRESIFALVAVALLAAFASDDGSARAIGGRALQRVEPQASFSLPSVVPLKLQNRPGDFAGISRSTLSGHQVRGVALPKLEGPPNSASSQGANRSGCSDTSDHCGSSNGSASPVTGEGAPSGCSNTSDHCGATP